MPTVFSHPAIALATTPLLQGLKRKPLLVISGALLTVLPDLDVVAFKFGIPYRHTFGHRGISHSILFAFMASILFTSINRQKGLDKNLLVWGYLFICGLSHGLLDAATNGGLGIGLFLPFSAERFFFPYRPIEVSTLSITRFFNGQGGFVLQNEILYLWLPAIGLFLLLYVLLRIVKTVSGHQHPNRC